MPTADAQLASDGQPDPDQQRVIDMDESESALLIDEDEPLPPRRRPVIVPAGTILPPAPPGTRNLRVRGLGIVIADDDLRERVERRFHWPMILLALAVLPLLAIELLQKPTGRIEFWVEFGFWMIWIAFLVEFVVKIAIAESRWEYVKRNWLDVVVILVPLLRPLRLTSLSRTIRLFKLRGVGFKLARSLVMLFVSFEVADRLLRRFGIERPKKPLYPAPTKMTRYMLMDEVAASRKRLEQWESWYAEHTGFLEGQGVLTYEVPDDAPPITEPPRAVEPPSVSALSAIDSPKIESQPVCDPPA